MIKIVYAIDNSRRSIVKIKSRGKNWVVMQLKKITKVVDMGTSETLYKCEWDSKQSERVWNRERNRYSKYFTYKPYEDKDVSEFVTVEMINYIKAYSSHLISWHIPTSLKKCNIPDGYESIPQ